MGPTICLAGTLDLTTPFTTFLVELILARIVPIKLWHAICLGLLIRVSETVLWSGVSHRALSGLLCRPRVLLVQALLVRQRQGRLVHSLLQRVSIVEARLLLTPKRLSGCCGIRTVCLLAAFLLRWLLTGTRRLARLKDFSPMVDSVPRTSGILCLFLLGRIVESRVRSLLVRARVLAPRASARIIMGAIGYGLDQLVLKPDHPSEKDVLEAVREAGWLVVYPDAGYMAALGIRGWEENTFSEVPHLDPFSVFVRFNGVDEISRSQYHGIE
jgi:hypothetical protein